MKQILFLIGAALIGAQSATLAEGPRLIIAPQSTILTAKGVIRVDACLHNDGKFRIVAPWPEAAFSAVWTLRDVSRVRPDRNGVDAVVGTDTVKQVVLKPGEAKSCRLGESFLAEPGDILEFYIVVKAEAKSGKMEEIRSNQ